MIESVKESVSELKSPDKSQKDKREAYNILYGSILKKYGKRRLTYNVSNRKKRSEWWKKKQRNLRSDRIDEK